MKASLLIITALLLAWSASAIDVCPTWDVPQTRHYDGNPDVFRLISGGPVQYSYTCEITTNNNSGCGQGSGTLVDGQNITFTYPAIGTWGPADQFGTHDAHITLNLNGPWGLACSQFNNYKGFDWSRWYNDSEFSNVPEFGLAGIIGIIAIAAAFLAIRR